MKMKFIAGTAALMLLSVVVNAQVLFTVGKDQVTTEEFLRAFNKNNTNATSKMEVSDYLDLYTSFKLKVKAARDARMDTLPHMREDVNLFRSQVIDNYLADESGVQMMVKEAFIRSQKDLRITHFSIEPSGKDSVAVIRQFTALHKALAAGGSISKQNKPTSFKQEDFGFITAFSLPYFYENIVYSLPVGGYSTPVFRNNKWHMFKVESVRPAAGTWKASQILLAFPAGSTDAEKQAIRKRSDSIYALLKNSFSFSEAASTFSNDRITNMTGGLLPSFGAGRYSAEFETPVFALRNDNDITPPFETEYGYHIVKRMSVEKINTDSTDVNNLYELKQKVMADARMQLAKEKYEKQIVALTGWTVTNKALKASIINYAVKDKLPAAALKDKTLLGKYKSGNTLKIADWAGYVSDYWKTHEDMMGLSNEEFFNGFEKKMALQEYTNHLEAYNQDFKYQLKEFNEGNLLFETMEKNVWGKSSEDDAALLQYYNSNKAKYLWEPSADAVVINCTSKELAEQTMTSLKNGANLSNLMLAASGKIFSDSARFVIDQLIDKKNAPNPSPGVYSSIVTNTENGGSFVIFKKLYPSGEQRSFSDARGLVINDYQEVLEKQWVSQLKKKYPVVVDLDELQKIIKAK